MNDDHKSNDRLKNDIHHLDELIETMHDAEKSRTFEEQVAYLKAKGIDPAKNFKRWDDDKQDD